MGDGTLASHLIGNAEARRDALLAAARDEAQRLVARARDDADGLAGEAAEASRRDAGRERERRLGAARADARRIVARARASLVEAILSRVAERIALVPGSARYPDIAERLCREILGEMPEGRCVVSADHVTAEAFGRLAPEAACRLDPLPPDALGGIELSDEAGAFRARNTLASRFLKARPTLVESIGLTLGSPDG